MPPRWESLRTEASRRVEQVLKDGGFEQVDAYQVHRFVTHVRVISAKFADKSEAERDKMCAPWLDRLSDDDQADIMRLLMFTPEEADGDPRTSHETRLSYDFDDPQPSRLARVPESDES